MDYVAEFIARGGKVTVAPTGERALDNKERSTSKIDREQSFHLAQDAASESRLTSRR